MSHVSDNICQENIDVLFEFQKCKGKDEQFKNIVDGCKKIALRVFKSDFCLDDLEEIGLDLEKTILENCPACSDRDRAINVAKFLDDDNGEKTIQKDVITNLRLVRMWANAAIALDGVEHTNSDVLLT
jgi:hypothetical protein